MLKSIVRLLSFFGKELNEVRRQPRLILSLIIGPLLILFLVGIGYTGVRPPLRVALVMSDELRDDPRVQEALEMIDGGVVGGIKGGTELVEISSDQAALVARLQAGELDIVQIIPPDLLDSLDSEEQTSISILYQVQDPQLEGFIILTGFREIQALNDIFLVDYIESVQANSEEALTNLRTSREGLEAFTGHETVEDLETLSTQLETTDLVLATMESSLKNAPDGTQMAQTYENVRNARSDIADARQKIADGEESISGGGVASITEQMRVLETELEAMQAVPAPVVASPLNADYQNLAGQALDLDVFFAPAVLAFIIQHIAVTLGALSLVRERQRGVQAFYGVAPISVMQVLIGKYIAYTLFCSVIASGLTALIITLMGVPFLTSIPLYAAYTLLFIVASLGVGFLISVLANSDIQAVQLAMLVLLLAVFFSGFVLPLDFFRGAVIYVGSILPVTHAIQGMRDLTLSPGGPQLANWLSLGSILIVTLLAVSVIWRRSFRTQET